MTYRRKALAVATALTAAVAAAAPSAAPADQAGENSQTCAVLAGHRQGAQWTERPEEASRYESLMTQLHCAPGPYPY